MSWWSAAVATWLVVWGAVAPVEAQAPVAAPNAEAPGDEEARALFRAGRAAFDEGRYEAALERFEQSYALSERPALLYNIGQAADRLRHDARAVDAFERYLAETEPDAPNRTAVEARLVVLRRQLEAERILAPAPARRGLRIGLGIGAAVVVVGVVLTAVLLTTRDPKQRDTVPGDPEIGIGGIVETLRRR
jgi:tetratricopeptide (TPR) repeat protein